MTLRLDRSESGQITAFVVVFMLALMLFAGLTADGGLNLAARRQAFNEADSAARAGANALSRPALYGGGPSTPQPGQARAAVAAYLTRTGHNWQVDITGNTVTVRVWWDRPNQILKIAGLRTSHIEARATAHPIQGVA